MPLDRPSTSPAPQRPAKSDNIPALSKGPAAKFDGADAVAAEKSTHGAAAEKSTHDVGAPRSTARRWPLRILLMCSMFGHVFQSRELIAPETTRQLEKALLCEVGTFCLPQSIREVATKAGLFATRSAQEATCEESGLTSAHEQLEASLGTAMTQVAAAQADAEAFKRQAQLSEKSAADANALIRAESAKAEVAAASCRAESACHTVARRRRPADAAALRQRGTDHACQKQLAPTAAAARRR